MRGCFHSFSLMPNGAKSWCFTLNNYTEEEYSKCCSFVANHEQVEYGIVGKEVGDGGTPHLQGYFKLRQRRDMRALQHQLSSRAHYEVARGSPRQNREYCIKDGRFEEFGRKPAEVRAGRDELAVQFGAALSEGVTGLDGFARANPGCWYFSGHNLLRNALTLCRPVERPDVRVDWIWGPPGVGKSRRAHAELPDAYVKEPRTKWWNGYLMEKDVIIDDFGPGGIDINHLLRWFDRYKCLVENKGGMIPLYATRFIVTSNFSPYDCFYDRITQSAHVQHEALLRRMTVINLFE